MREIIAVECAWCAAIQAGNANFPMQITAGQCAHHKAIWLSAATAGLALARMQITKGKWRTHWAKTQAQAIRAAGGVPVHLPDGSVGVARVVAERVLPE